MKAVGYPATVELRPFQRPLMALPSTSTPMMRLR
jgi:hypothetical protein